MKKIAQLMLICLLPLFATAQPQYTRVIVFGDSLSDIGNMPESPNLIEPKFKTIALNLYVPIANPIINGENPTYKIPGSNLQLTYPPHAPQAQPPLIVHDVRVPRKAYSLTWPQFFTHEAASYHLLVTDKIWPWFWWKTHPNHNQNLSIDYAWAGAVTDNQCRDFSYQNPNPNCTEKSILAGQAKYRAAGFNPQLPQSIAPVQVPGVQKQINMFLEDATNNPSLADQDNLYVILIGGNDLNLALLNLKEHHVIKAFSRVLGAAAKRVRFSLETLIEKCGARHIVLFNLFDTSQIPYIQTQIWKQKGFSKKKKPEFIKFSRLMTNIYNRELAFVIKRINYRYNGRTKQVDIQLFNYHQLMNDMMKQPAFSSSKTKYKTCLGFSTDKPAEYYASPNDCTNGDDKYLFWNGAHPAMYLDQAVAHKLVEQLLATKPLKR